MSEISEEQESDSLKSVSSRRRAAQTSLDEHEQPRNTPVLIDTSSKNREQRTRLELANATIIETDKYAVREEV